MNPTQPGRVGYSGHDLKNDIKRFGIFSSSTDPQKISKMVQGFVTTGAGAIVTILAFTGHAGIIPDGSIADGARQIGEFAGLIIQAGGIAFMLVGAAHKLIVWASQFFPGRYPQAPVFTPE